MFLTLDLSNHWNAARDNSELSPGSPPPWQADLVKAFNDLPYGDQSFWGIPFSLAPNLEGKSWIVLGPGDWSTEIFLEGDIKASFLVFAHVCNSPEIEQINPATPEMPVFEPGQHLADYVLIYSDGTEHTQAIRRRFEINELMAYWGHLAFAARPHHRDYPLMENMQKAEAGVVLNHTGVSGGWGWEQTGVVQGAYRSKVRLWIYALPNPRPQSSLRSIRLLGSGADTMAIAGITLFKGLNHPLRYLPRKTIKVGLPSKITESNAGLMVEVDLGIVSRIYTVSNFDPASWLVEESKGCGSPTLSEEASDQLLIDLTTSPDAEIRIGDHKFLLGEAYKKGFTASKDGAASIEILDPQRTWMTITVVDSKTGFPIPTRAHFRTPDGRYIPPYGHRQVINDNWFEDYGGDLMLGQTSYAYVDGCFQIELPVGDCYVELCKGFEYEPIRRKLKISPGDSELKLQMHRKINTRQNGWVTADTHVHFLSPQTAWLEARAEGINLVNLLAAQWGDMFTNVCDITGDVSGVSNDDTIVWVGTENRQHLLGHISLLGGQGEPVRPFSTSGPGESTLGDPTRSTLADWSEQCRNREGLVVIPHFPNPYCEVVADIILGKVDALEIRDFQVPTANTYAVREWYRFLNLGYRIAAVGGTDKMSAGMPIGGVRTYAQLLNEPFTFTSWAKAVRDGRTFTTSGPLIDLEVEGMGLGSTIHLPRNGGKINIKAHAISLWPFDWLQLVINGDVVDEINVKGKREAILDKDITVEKSSWICARCYSSHIAWHVWPVHLVAHTSPIYVDLENKDLFNLEDAAYMMSLLEGGLTWINVLSTPPNTEQHEKNKDVFISALHLLDRRIKRAL